MFKSGVDSVKELSWICRSCKLQLHTSRLVKTRHYAVQSAPRKASQKLPDRPARTRFAPSPTGYLHLGSLRTALFNYLLAKATNGQFLLRIEDTDRKRTVPGAEERICRDLEWAGLQWDEGPEIGGPYGPYKQSERTAVYHDYTERLLNSGNAYRCFCTQERLAKLAEARNRLGLPTDYDRTCAGILKEESDDRASKGERYTVRLKVPSAYPQYTDLVYGKVGAVGGKTTNPKSVTYKYGEQVYEDPILIKSDGLPTYHLANVVDDHLMEITHVIRAVEWMPSTPKHLAIYEAFGWDPPAFAHVGLLQDQDGRKLSKRNLDIDIESFKKNGIFPEALVNYAALLGWSHTLGKDILDLDRLVENFDLKFTKGNTIVNFQKLNFLQRQYAQNYAGHGGPKFEDMIDRVKSIVLTEISQSELDIDDGRDLRKYIEAILVLEAKQYTSPKDFFERSRSFFTLGTRRAASQLKGQHDEVVAAMATKLSDVTAVNWNATHLQCKLDSLVQELMNIGIEDLQNEKQARIALLHWLRLAIMDAGSGPAMTTVMELLGRDIILRRLQEAQKIVNEL